METFLVTITGSTPLLMHADNIEWADKMDLWKNHPENRTKSKAGDDRTPPWRWIGCLNYDDPDNGHVALPSEYIMGSCMGGGAEVATGKGKKTFKSQTQSGMLSEDLFWPLKLEEDYMVPMAGVQKLMTLKTFQEHSQAVRDFGFSLFVKRARIGQSKHIRVRPRFDKWSATGKLIVTDEQITEVVLKQILEIAGKRKGLGDWRPGAPKPGPFGTFTAEIAKL